MKKLLLASILLFTLTSCAKSAMLKTCTAIAGKEMTGLDGFKLSHTSIHHVDGLKLVIPEKYGSAEHVASVAYKSPDDDYKSCTCYFDSSNELMGFSAN